MYTQLARAIAVSTSTDAYTQMVDMGETNAVNVDFVIINLGGATNLTVHVETGNDGENWETHATDSGAKTAVGSYSFSVPSSGAGIAARYVRLKLVATGTGTVIASVGVNRIKM